MYKKDIASSNSIEGTIEEIAEVITQYVTAEGIAVVGIGERAHETYALRTITLPNLLPSFAARKGWKAVLVEDMLKDISPKEWDLICGELKRYSQRDTMDIRINKLRDFILGEPKTEILRFSYNNIDVQYDKESLLALIIKIIDLNMNLFGILTSDQIKNNSPDKIMDLFTEHGLEGANKLKRKWEKLIILCGDWHATCLPLYPSELYPDAARFCFGDSLFADKDYPYLNVSVVNGTKEDIIKNKIGFGELGYQFYLSELETLPLGMARIRLIKEEKQHRILLLYHSPVQRTVFPKL